MEPLLRVALIATLGVSISACTGDGDEPEPEPSYSMESPAAFADSDVGFVEDLLAYRRQALELFDAYEGGNEEIDLLVESLDGPYEQEVQELLGLLDSWEAEPPTAEESLAASKLQGAVEEEDIEELSSLPAADQDEEFLDLFIGNQQGVVRLATSTGEAGDSSEVRRLANEASRQSTGLIVNLQDMRDD